MHGVKAQAAGCPFLACLLLSWLFRFSPTQQVKSLSSHQESETSLVTAVEMPPSILHAPGSSAGQKAGAGCQ